MTALENVKFACLDTETTGLSPVGGGKICEIAVSVTQNGQPIERFSSLINPHIPMHPSVIAVHGITNEMVAGAPAFEDILPKLWNILEGCVLVAHNAEFDLNFLRAEFQNCGMRFPEYPVLDTLKLARKNGCFERNNLGVVAQTLGICAEGAHRAMADVLMTEKILYRFLQDFINGGVNSLEDVQACQFKRHESIVLGKTGL